MGVEDEAVGSLIVELQNGYQKVHRNDMDYSRY